MIVFFFFFFKDSIYLPRFQASKNKQTNIQELLFQGIQYVARVLSADIQAAATNLLVAMAQKRLRITSANGDEKMISVMDTTTVREILQQCQEDDDQDRKATLLQGVTLLKPDMSVSEAGLEDGDNISLVWSDLFVEISRWTGSKTGNDLYVRIPTQITSIDSRAFCNCKDLIKLVIPNSVTRIGESAFESCSSLTQLEIPNSVTSIEEEAFADCGSLKHMNIPDSASIIERRVFAGCSSLDKVHIPNSVTMIGRGAFVRCSSLTQLEIPNSVTGIGHNAFRSCSSLTQVEIPDSVTSIGESAFHGCSSLTEVEISNSGTNIGSRAFAGCSSLTVVKIRSVTGMDLKAFDKCIADPVTTIGDMGPLLAVAP